MNNIARYCRSKVFQNYFYLLSILVFVLFLFPSCRISKPTAYFNTISRDTTIDQYISKDLELKITKNDILGIRVSSLNPVEDAFYNMSSSSLSSSSSSSSLSSSSTPSSPSSSSSSAQAGMGSYPV